MASQESFVEEYLVQMTYVLLQVLLRLAEHPLSELAEVQSVFALMIGGQPLHEVLKVIADLVLVEYPVYHVAAEQL